MKAEEAFSLLCVLEKYWNNILLVTSSNQIEELSLKGNYL